MKRWVALAGGVVLVTVAVVAVVLASRGGESAPVAVPKSPPKQATPKPGTPVAVRTVVATCATRSMAPFGPAYTNPGNLVVGPLAMVGAADFTTPSTVGRVHGNKFPLLVRAGHTVSVEVAPSARTFAALGYGPLPQGLITLDVAHPSVTFVACPRGMSSGSTAGGSVTFWSGGLVANEPHCVPLDVLVDGATTPTRVFVELGARCRTT
jgi:hypothetical protein